MTGESLTFESYRRPALAWKGTLAGRAQAELNITLAASTGEADARLLPVELLGPGDVVGLLPGAVVAMQPAPGVLDADAGKLAFCELAEPDLPWRYTSAVPGPQGLRPWLVLVVGPSDHVALLPPDRVQLAAAVLDAHPTREAHRWAHVQVTASGHSTARLLSPTPLLAGGDYVAVIVPSFTADGADAWRPGSGQVLPCLHSWRFRVSTTSFVELALQLHAAQPRPELDALGTSRVRVPGGVAPVVVDTPGALVRKAPQPPAGMPVVDGPLPDPPAGPRVLQPPVYGTAWATRPTDPWREALRDDPRHRVAAGLGLDGGIALQEEIVAASAARAGSMEAAAQLVRGLVAGVEAARSLWQVRVPTDPRRLLMLLGPSLSRVITPGGTASEMLAGSSRALPAGLFSSAAARLFRSGGPVERQSAGGAEALDPAKLLPAFDRCPEPASMPEGLQIDDVRLDNIHGHAAAPGRGFEHLVEEAARDHRISQEDADHLERGGAEGLSPRVIEGIDPVDLPRPPIHDEDDELIGTDFREVHQAQQAALDAIGRFAQRTRVSPPACAHVDSWDRLGESLISAFQPVRGGLVDRRVLGRIDGLGPFPRDPVETCADLDLPAWRYLRDHNRSWLLPGAGALRPGEVIQVQTNPAFIDAFMVGLNTQALGELRFRNLPVRAGCTPLRRFWDLATPDWSDKGTDVAGVDSWGATTLGADAHDPHADAANPNASSRRKLVLVFRTELFRRYPRTLVSLVPALRLGLPPLFMPTFFARAPSPADNPQRQWPILTGQVGSALTFFGFNLAPEAMGMHWVVVEEAPPGYSFDGGRPDRDPAADNAISHFHSPVRVLIDGRTLSG